MKPLYALCLAAFLAQSSAFAQGVPPALPAARLDDEMKQIPESDPATPNAPKLLDTVKGAHPRLLFTQAEADALKQACGSDPILQKALEGVRKWTTMTPAISGPRPSIVAGDDRDGAYWTKAPNLAYAYVLDKDPAAKAKMIESLKTMVDVDHWADANNEVDSSMGAAQNMFITALMYDTVYNDLDPDTRTKVGQKLFTMARRMYYLGHKQLQLPFQGKGFWVSDPQPNHRWYRDMGLAACVLATADEQGIDSGALMQGLKDEMDFIMKWYPPDGDCHEGYGYQQYGIIPISLATAMMDRNIGTTYQKDSGLKNAWVQQFYFWVPGRRGEISWGDSNNSLGKGGFGGADGAFFLGPKLTQDKDAQGAMAYKLKRQSEGVADMIYPWTLLWSYDPSVQPNDAKALPLTHLLPDIGAASMRDSWDDDAVVFAFKCGPYGGYKLNEYRNSTTENGNPHYVNLAHDDPDANEFSMAVGAGFAFHPGNYTSYEKSKKLSTEHSTITVDGKGQVGEGDGFTQPVGNEDMTKFSYLTGWKMDDKGHVIIEGEAGPAYCGQTGPELKKSGNKQAPAVLKTYRRTAIWMPKEYVLILDNIQTASGDHEITWHGSAVKADNPNDGSGTITTDAGGSVKYQIVSNQQMQGKVVPITLLGRWTTDQIQQLQFTVKGSAVKFATVLDPWKTGATVKLTEANGAASVEVSGSGFDDTWSWTPAGDLTIPSSIEGKRSGATIVALTPTDVAPHK